MTDAPRGNILGLRGVVWARARLHWPRCSSVSSPRIGKRRMKRSNFIPNDNVIPFPGPERNRRAACTRSGGALAGDERGDHGPSPEESLRLMRAFVGIKNRQLRADLITMLEGASRTRAQAPVRGNE